MTTFGKAASRCLVYGGLVLITAALVVPLLRGRTRGPSFETQRKEQQRIVRERVSIAGGWAALRGACESLATNSSASRFYWTQNIEELPQTIRKLQPRTVELDEAAGNPTIVKIMLFGMHRTGGRDTPYYGLWVACGAARPGYTPVLNGGPGRAISEITNGVFEVYQ